MKCTYLPPPPSLEKYIKYFWVMENADPYTRQFRILPDGLPGMIYYPGGSGRVSFVSRNDIAEALSHVMIHDGFENKTLEITGSKAYSFAELAGMLSLTKGFEFHYSDMEEMQFEKTLRTLRLPEEVVQLLISMSKGIREGEFERTESTLEDILQRKPTLLTDYLKEL